MKKEEIGKFILFLFVIFMAMCLDGLFGGNFKIFFIILLIALILIGGILE